MSMNFKTSEASTVCLKSMHNIQRVGVTTLYSASCDVPGEHITTIFFNNGAGSIVTPNRLMSFIF